MTLEIKMLRWLLVTVLALVLISGLMPLLHKIGLGKLPGDFRTKVFGREIYVPLGTSIVLSLLAAGIAKLI